MRYPPLKYHGSKFKLASWYAALAPRPGTYKTRVIVCAGGLGEILGTDDWPIDGVSEVVNDFNREISDFWRCIREPYNFREFVRLASLTPFSQIEFDQRQEYKKSVYLPERALGFFIEQRQGVQGTQGDEISYATPVKSRLRRGMNEHVSAWLTAVEGLPELHKRLKRIEIRNLDCLTLMRQYDHADTFFFIDPPYLDETRTGGIGQYRNEWTPEQHTTLLHYLSSVKGKFLLCGYDSGLYSEWMERCGWRRYGKYVTKHSSRRAEKPCAWEYVWCNY